MPPLSRSPVQVTTLPTFSTKLVLLFSLTTGLSGLGGCSSTNLVPDNYAPRLSAKSAALEDTLEERENKLGFCVLAFDDQRDEGSQTIEASFIWRAKGRHEYRLAEKSLGAYLQEALAFDMKRFGFNMVRAKESTSTTTDLIAGATLSLPEGVKYALGIVVHTCEPDWTTGWSTVTTRSAYEYHLLLWDAEQKKIVLDQRLDKEIGASGAPLVTFVAMTDSLMNDHLAQLNVIIAESLLAYE